MIWSNLIIVVQVISALSIIGLVLMQHGKGADMGAAFGSGAYVNGFGSAAGALLCAALNAFGVAVCLAALVWLLRTRRLAPRRAVCGLVPGVVFAFFWGGGVVPRQMFKEESSFKIVCARDVGDRPTC